MQEGVLAQGHPASQGRSPREPPGVCSRAVSQGRTCFHTNRNCFFGHQRLLSRNVCEPLSLQESPNSELCHGSCLGPTYLWSHSLLRRKGLSASSSTMSSPGSREAVLRGCRHRLHKGVSLNYPISTKTSCFLQRGKKVPPQEGWSPFPWTASLSPP